MKKLFRKRKFEVSGKVSPGFERVRREFLAGFELGVESSAQLCVYVKGRCVVDLWGKRTHDDDSSYDADSLQNVFSSTKSLTAVVFATLVDRGLVSYDDKVALHWPEFAQNGKGDLRVCDVLRHEVGMVYLDETVMLEDMLPRNIKENAIGRIIERQTPCFPPEESGTKREYHGLTRGWILNEIFRRVEPTGRTIGEYLREEISRPLGADVFIGVTDEELARMADIKGWTVQKVAVESVLVGRRKRRVEQSLAELVRLMRRLQDKRRETAFRRPPAIEGMDKVSPNEFVPSFNRAIVRQGETPSGNGSCSARGLAKIGACVLNGGKFENVRILSENTVEEMHADLVRSMDYGIFGMATEFSQGGINLYRSYPEDNERERREKSLRDGFFGWMGFGGSVFQWHRDLDISFAYTPTQMCWYDLQNVRGARMQDAVVSCVKEMGQ